MLLLESCNCENCYSLADRDCKFQAYLILDIFRFSFVVFPFIPTWHISGQSAKICNTREVRRKCILLAYIAKGVYFMVFTLWKMKTYYPESKPCTPVHNKPLYTQTHTHTRTHAQIFINTLDEFTISQIFQSKVYWHCSLK